MATGQDGQEPKKDQKPEDKAPEPSPQEPEQDLQPEQTEEEIAAEEQEIERLRGTVLAVMPQLSGLAKLDNNSSALDIKKVQAALSALGQEVPRSGKIDDATVAAIWKFQRDNIQSPEYQKEFLDKKDAYATHSDPNHPGHRKMGAPTLEQLKKQLASSLSSDLRNLEKYNAFMSEIDLLTRGAALEALRDDPRSQPAIPPEVLLEASRSVDPRLLPPEHRYERNPEDHLHEHKVYGDRDPLPRKGVTPSTEVIGAEKLVTEGKGDSTTRGVYGADQKLPGLSEAQSKAQQSALDKEIAAATKRRSDEAAEFKKQYDALVKAKAEAAEKEKNNPTKIEPSQKVHGPDVDFHALMAREENEKRLAGGQNPLVWHPETEDKKNAPSSPKKTVTLTNDDIVPPRNLPDNKAKGAGTGGPGKG